MIESPAADIVAGVRQHTVGRSAPWHGERRRRRTDVLVVHPAEVDTGVRFQCHSAAATDATLAARWDTVIDTRGGVVLGNAHGVTLRGVIPLLAALRVAGVDNAVVEVQGARIPAEAGDFTFYLDMLAEVGVQAQPTPRRLLRVTDTIEVRDSFGFATLSPASEFRACVNTTTIRAGGHTDNAYGVVVSDFAEPHGGYRAALGEAGAELLLRSTDTGGSRPRPGMDTLPAPLRAAAVELIGHLALAGAPVAGCVHARGSGPSLYQALLHAVMERRAITFTTVDTQRACDRTVTPAAASPAICPVCDSTAGRL